LSPFSFLDGNGHTPAAVVAQPEILDLAPVFTDAAVIVNFHLCHKQLAVAKAKKCCGACGIGAFVEHRGVQGFTGRLAMPGERFCQPSLRLPSIGRERVRL